MWEPSYAPAPTTTLGAKLDALAKLLDSTASNSEPAVAAEPEVYTPVFGPYTAEAPALSPLKETKKIHAEKQEEEQGQQGRVQQQHRRPQGPQGNSRPMHQP